jgi:Lon protease-like protein
MPAAATFSMPSRPFDPATFSGTARLFPLPNVVLFPHVIQPLHIFEPRYCQMLEEALADDRLLAMAVLMPGWEKDYEQRPPVYPVACLGRVVTHERLADGRYNLLLRGVSRIEIVRELPPHKTFREAQARLIGDHADHSAASNDLRSQLLAACKRRLARATRSPQQLEHLDQMLTSEAPLEMLADILGYVLDFDQSFKVQLLADANVERRARRLIERLESESAPPDASLGGQRFPPDFSPN